MRQMLHLVTTLKKKSEREKTRYAFLFALCMTLLVGAIWTTSLPARFAQIAPSEGAGNISDSKESAGFADLLESSKAQVGTLIEGVHESATVPESENTDSYLPSSDAFDTLTPVGYETADTASYDVPENIPTDTPQNTALAATSSTVTILAKPAPQIIMIATTTSQKSE